MNQNIPPAYEPDHDLLEEIVAVVNKHVERCSVGKIVGSLLAAVVATVHARSTIVRPITPALMHDLGVMAGIFIAKYRPRDDKASRIIMPGDGRMQ